MTLQQCGIAPKVFHVDRENSTHIEPLVQLVESRLAA